MHVVLWWEFFSGCRDGRKGGESNLLFHPVGKGKSHKLKEGAKGMVLLRARGGGCAH